MFMITDFMSCRTAKDTNSPKQQKTLYLEVKGTQDLPNSFQAWFPPATPPPQANANYF